MPLVSSALRGFLRFALALTIFSTLAFSAWSQESTAPDATSAAPRPLITLQIDNTRLTVLTGNTHPMARPQYDLGSAQAGLSMQRMLLVLKRSPEQEFAMRKLLDEQQDKSSPNYHQWLTPEQFGKQFGPGDSDMQTITAWLQSQGFEVTNISKGRTVIEFSGTAAQVQTAFHTAIHQYLVNGEQHWANASDPSIPMALTPVVAGIDSLNNFQKKAMNSFVGVYSAKTKSLRSPAPSFTTAGCIAGCYAVSPYDFATIYDVLPLWNAGIDGTGQTIAIVGRTDINPADATTFWQIFGLTVPSNKLNIIVNGDDPGVNGDEDEADIDVQWSGAVAPKATIDYVTTASTTTTDGVDLSALYIVDNNLAPVMSESYGQCELGIGTAGNAFYYALWGQAAAQGISAFVSTGDNGAAGCDNPGGPAQYGLNVNGIASTPFNAAIGGTDFNEYNKWSTYWNATNDPTTQESAKGYIPETAWNDSCTNPLYVVIGAGNTAEQACNNPQLENNGGANSTGGSGGVSNCTVNSQQLGTCSQGYAKPSWQSGSGVPSDNRRDLPDVALFASNGFLGSFYLICQQDQTYGVCGINDLLGYGGTSVASPAFAGIMALVNQKMGAPQGVPGFALYKLATQHPTAFHDVPAGSTIAMPCYTGSPNCTTSTGGDQLGILSGYNTTAGYDLATGLGTVDASNLVNNWGSVTFTATTTSLQLNGGSAVNVQHGTAVPINIGVSPAAASGDVALLVSTGTGNTTGAAIDSFPLSGGSVTRTTSVLPGGTYSVIAHYGGNGVYGGSYSSPVSVTVSKENSTVSFPGLYTASQTITTTVGYDWDYWLSADVENSHGTTCNPAPLGEIACPTGSITFTVDGQPFGAGTFALNNFGHVETVSQPTPLTGGTHTLKAAYSGDASYNASSATVVVTVNKASTNTSAPTSGANNFTQPVLITVLVQDPNSTSVDALPTGTVTFYSNGTALTGTVNYTPGSGAFQGTYATLTTTFSAPGTYSITAIYSGDQNYAGSTSSASSLTLQYPTPGITLSPFTQTVAPGGTVTVTALVDSSNKTTYPTGTVELLNLLTGPITDPTSCTNAKDNNGFFACKVVFTLPATTSMYVYAQYSGDVNYPYTSSGTVNIIVPDFSLTSPNTLTISQGQSGNLNIAVNALGGFSGNVNSFSCSGLPAEATCLFSPTQVAAGGSTTLTVTTTPVGQLRRRAAQARSIPWDLTVGTLFLGLCLIGIPASRRKYGPMIALMIFAAFVILPSCGGGGGEGGGGGSNHPVPSITSLQPASAAQGSQPETLVISGTGFISTSTATFNGSAHATTFLGGNQISMQLTGSDLSATGAFPVAVSNPAPGGGSSGSVNFNVETGTPTGSFNITVNATSGSVTHSETFSLVVQ